jgi:putative oxidoreductase
MRSPLAVFEPVAPYGWPLVRFAGGILLATHGFAKIAGGIGGFAEGLAKMGVPAPEVMAWVSALAELVGGVFMAIGLFTRAAGMFVAGNMLVALWLAHRGDLAKIGSGGSSPAEYPLLLAAIGVGALMVGPGRCTVDALLRRRRTLESDAASYAPRGPRSSPA